MLFRSDTDGEKFGYYLDSEVIERYKDYESKTGTYYTSFHFNLQSNGRLQQPMKFDIKHLIGGGYVLYGKSDWYLILLGDIRLSKENKKNKSSCFQNEDQFDYNGNENALCGKTNSWKNDGKNFTPKRILVIQMK